MVKGMTHLLLATSLLLVTSFRVGPPPALTSRTSLVARRACGPLRMEEEDVDKSEVCAHLSCTECRAQARVASCAAPRH
eukprot:31527-Prymnesium_polylepis.1